MVEYRHDTVPGDNEDPGRCKGRSTFLHLKVCHFMCRTVEHSLGVHVGSIELVVLLNEGEERVQQYRKYDTTLLCISNLSNLIKQPPIPMGEVNIIPKCCQQSNISVARETVGKRSREEVLFILTDRLKLDKSII